MNKYFYNENGFTLIEVLTATVILAVGALVIFYSSLQATNNYISAEKYYQATIDAQNILEEVKAQLDKDIDRLRYDSIDKLYKTQNYPMQLSSYIPTIENLGLDIDKYSYEVYLTKYENNIPNGTTITSIDNDLLYSYYYSALIPAVYTSSIQLDFTKQSNIIDNSSPIISADILNDNIIDINNETGIIGKPINYDLRSVDLDENLKISVKNYQDEDIEINIYANHAIKYNPINDLILQSYSSSGAVHINFYNKVAETQGKYIVVVVVTDNTKDDKSKTKVLKQLTDIY